MYPVLYLLLIGERKQDAVNLTWDMVDIEKQLISYSSKQKKENKPFIIPMIGMIEEKFLSWAQKGPLTFLGYSSINFDDEVLRKEFFKALRKPYLTNTGGNVRHDALNIVRAAFAIDDEVLKTELNDKGNKSMKLESLSRLNGIDSAGAHNA